MLGGTSPEDLATTRGSLCNRSLSVANDLMVSNFFYFLILVGGAFYFYWVAVPVNSVLRARDLYTRPNSATPGAHPTGFSYYWFFSVPWMVLWGSLSAVLLTLTLVADPGIVSWRKRELLGREDPAPVDSTEPVIIHNRTRSGGSQPETTTTSIPKAVPLAGQQLHNRAQPATTTWGAAPADVLRNIDRESRECAGGIGGDGASLDDSVVQYEGDIEVPTEPAAQSIYTNAAEERLFGGTEVYYCPVCWVYIDGFDHHCGVIGACIGKGTMPLFVLFLMSVTVYCATAIFFVGHKIVMWWHHSDGLPNGTKTTITQAVLIQVVEPVFLFGLLVVSVLATAFCGGMFLYYMSRIAIGSHSLVRRRLSGFSDNESERLKIFSKATFKDLGKFKLGHIWTSIVTEGMGQFRLAPVFGVIKRGPNMKHYNKDSTE